MGFIVNTTDITALIAKDPKIKAIHDLYGQPESFTRPQEFETLCRIILEQHVSLASAKAHFLKLKNYISVFEPDLILKLSDEEFKRCQISRQKTTYLRSLAEAVNSKTLKIETLAQLTNAQIREELTKVKGIGNWTTNVYLMFSLQRKDLFPIGDVALRTTIKELYHINDKENMIQLSENWSPFKSLASYFLWHYYLKSRNRPTIF